MGRLDALTNITHESDSSPVDPTTVFGPQRDSLFIVLPITIVYSLIFIIGVLGDLLTCVVIVRNKSMHTATNYYLFSLAISDLLLLISGMPQEMYSMWSKWPYVFGQSFCVIRGLAAETSTNASVLTITLFTVERYLAICHPFVSHKMSKLSRATKHVILLWVVALGLALPQALQFGIRDHSGVTMCLQTRVIIEHSFEISTFVFFFAPMILITVLYALIGLKLRETNISRTQSQKAVDISLKYTHKLRRQHSQSTRKVIKMLVAVVVAFFICWAPFHAQRLVAIYGTTEHHQAKSPILLYVYSFLTYISGIFYYMSTCINPIFYHIMSNKFREAFKSTMTQSGCCSSERSSAARCTYTAMAFARHPTSSGTANSGNSHKNSVRPPNMPKLHLNHRDGNINSKSTPIIHICCDRKNNVPVPLQDCTQYFESKCQPAIRQDNFTNRHLYLDTSACVSHDKQRPRSPVSNTYLSSPVEIVDITPDVSDENKEQALSDEPEKYLHEIKLRIMQMEKDFR